MSVALALCFALLNTALGMVAFAVAFDFWRLLPFVDAQVKGRERELLGARMIFRTYEGVLKGVYLGTETAMTLAVIAGSLIAGVAWWAVLLRKRAPFTLRNAVWSGVAYSAACIYLAALLFLPIGRVASGQDFGPNIVFEALMASIILGTAQVGQTFPLMLICGAVLGPLNVFVASQLVRTRAPLEP
jgi:hypothetical protein